MPQQEDYNSSRRWRSLSQHPPPPSQVFPQHVNIPLSSMRYPRRLHLGGNQVSCLSLLSAQGVEEKREQEEVKDAWQPAGCLGGR